MDLAIAGRTALVTGASAGIGLLTARALCGRGHEVWGTGRAQREFMHVDDLANACLLLMEEYDEVGHINSSARSESAVRGG